MKATRASSSCSRKQDRSAWYKAQVRLVCSRAVSGVCCGYMDKTVYQYLVDKGYTGFIELLRETGQVGLVHGLGKTDVCVCRVGRVLLL